ncbi:MAG TPA: hypothetical protein VGK27_01210 [Candidatus Deferrimicrobiaceae bacterium]|jgi:hypothetical protein
MRRLTLSPIALLLVSLITSCGSSGGGTSGTERAPLTLAGTVSTFAGTGVATFAGSEPTFFGPSGVVKVGSDLFVTDMGNNTIRKVVIATGETTTLAGSGVPGHADGTGSDSSFWSPGGITSDGTNLYVVDRSNSRIRQVVIATGEVTTLAGRDGPHESVDGTGSAAEFAFPEGIATDGTNLYVTESGSKIRKVVIATGVVTTIANFSNGIRHPYGIATDNGTNLYLTSSDNTIQKMVVATLEVTTLAGRPGATRTDNAALDGTGSAATFYNPWGIAIDGTNLFVTDSRNHTVRKVVIATGAVTTLAGGRKSAGYADGAGSAARFNLPWGIATDGTELFLADYMNFSVRKVAIASAEVTTVSGSPGFSADGTAGEATFNNPSGAASDGRNLFVADTCNHTIRKIVIATGAVTTLAGYAGEYGVADGNGSDARFNNPSGLATDGTNVYVADTGNCTIRKIAIATGETTTLAGRPEEVGAADGFGSEATFNSPYGIATDGTNLYVADTANHTIRKVVIATGEVTSVAGAAGIAGASSGMGAAATFNQPAGITYDGGNLYVADTFNGTVRKIVLATGAVTTLAGISGAGGSDDGMGSGARFDLPTGIASDGMYLYVSDQGNHTIRKIVIATREVTTIAGSASHTGATNGAGTDARFYYPTGLATDGTSLFVADCFNNAIRVIR